MDRNEIKVKPGKQWIRLEDYQPKRKKSHGDKALLVLVLIAGIVALVWIIIPGIRLIVRG